MPTQSVCALCGKPSQTLRPITGHHRGRMLCPACYVQRKTKYSIRPATNQWEVVMTANGVESVRRRCATREEASKLMLQFAGHYIEPI